MKIRFVAEYAGFGNHGRTGRNGTKEGNVMRRVFLGAVSGALGACYGLFRNANPTEKGHNRKKKCETQKDKEIAPETGLFCDPFHVIVFQMPLNKKYPGHAHRA